MMARMEEVESGAAAATSQHHRALLAGPAGALFREVVEAGSMSARDPRLRPGDDAHESFTVLRDLGLLRATDDGTWLPVDPSAVQPGLVAPLGRQAVDLLAESAAWAQSLAALGQVYRRTPPAGATLTEVRGLLNINRYLDAAVDDAEEELLTAQPRGARRPVVLEQAVNRDLRAIQRGVAMRTLYQHTARSSRSTRDYVAKMLDLGAQVRTLDEFFNRLIVIDRRLALIPGDAPETAVVIHDGRVVSYLVDLFERSWERGREYESRVSGGHDSGIAEEVRQLTVRMLTEGHSDSASAKRVGVSTRTYATYVAALKQEYGVATRFQLGLAMGSQDAGSAPEHD